MAPFKKLYKNTSVLVSSLLNCFLHFNQALGLTNLYQQHITNHITAFNHGLIAGNSFSHIIQHRLHQIAKDINIPFSSLLLECFKPFMKTTIMTTNLVFRIIFHEFNIGISFATPLQASRSVEHTYIFTLFDNDPGLYSRLLHSIKRSNIQTLDQCMSADGSVLLLFREAFHRNNPIDHSGNRAPKWYQHVIACSYHENSIQIRDEFLHHTNTDITAVTS